MDLEPQPFPVDDRTERPVRRLVDETGRRWRVWLADTRRVPGAPRGECLIFDGTDVVRRVWEVPAGWEAFSPRTLLGLVEPAADGRAEGCADGCADAAPRLADVPGDAPGDVRAARRATDRMAEQVVVIPLTCERGDAPGR